MDHEETAVTAEKRQGKLVIEDGGCDQMTHERITSKEGLEMEAAVRELAIRWPEVTEKVDGFGHTSFRVSDKPFVIMGEGGAEGPALSFKVLKTTQELLLAQEHFYKTPYIGHHGWVSIRAQNVADYSLLADYLLEGYLCAAPKRLAKQMQAQLPSLMES
ncbi:MULTISPECIES: MmcQ/YjbR family DNA-binding protein [Brevibacillus]|uniref:MmcQ/YjbR family DNA-binding protein n=1 Tax=Brevibacillus TaxID=55080 RepID=UPI001E56853E|nr:MULTISPECIES: MmcQ/YjbR family DNA-binding protein [Brevibacillus]MDH6353375.1 putative DNA-binding protein (MmcQ/YjbR family) [Brevibacillus sp. 1238]MDR5001616.1 MmcQ/YjbR family DNA-binding protein [Brevibacillus parabrevis]UED69519.1 MmcQ/YjbR family DNA-binding protein [Brevibacillus sp. HD3.3A]WDV95798.1 MmcQ/YjbR family DNA-binding protein [Brevibacillus parabrevis]